MRFWVTWCYAIHLPEVLEIVDAQFIAEKVQQRVLEHASMAVRQHEAISVQPVWVLGVEGHEFVEEDVGDRCHTHGRARVARVGLEGGIDLLSPARQLLYYPYLFYILLTSIPILFIISAVSVKCSTYREGSDGVDTQLVQLVVTHLDKIPAVPMGEDGVVPSKLSRKIVDSDV